MLITTFEQINHLFNSETPESQILDYKKDLYILSAIQKGGKVKKKKQQDTLELLKDVGALLNSTGGSIVLGIKDNKVGEPSNSIQDAGIQDIEYPVKYEEVVQSKIATGFTPVCQVDVRRVKNEANSNSSFLVINVPIQYSPLFARVRNENGEDDLKLFVRRGRNIGIMEPREIETRIQEFKNRSKQFVERIEELSSTSIRVGLNPLFYAYPTSPLIISALDYSNHLRGENSWEDASCNSYKVTRDELNQYPNPTLEGIEIKSGCDRLHLYESGLITWDTDQLESETIKFRGRDGRTFMNKYKLLDPQSLSERVKNFARFSLHTYHLVGYYGDFTLGIRLRGCENSYLCKRPSDYRSVLADLRRDEHLAHEMRNSSNGPRKCGNSVIPVKYVFSTLNFDGKNLNYFDSVIKKKIIDYIWRAYGFESSY
ncbi:MAG: ATP-binding protein [Patescibacteria group bacterium]